MRRPHRDAKGTVARRRCSRRVWTKGTVMSRLGWIAAKVFHGDNGLAPRDWVAPAADDQQPPPYERTAMALPTDVAMMLAARAEREGLGDGWRHSVEGLLGLLGLDTSTE